jgi:hypothetical protein
MKTSGNDIHAVSLKSKQIYNKNCQVVVIQHNYSRCINNANNSLGNK